MATKDKGYDHSPHANRTRLGKLLLKYDGRILRRIRMSIDKTGGVPNRYKYFFVRLEDEPAFIVANPRYRPPGWEDILRSHKPPGWEEVITAEEQRWKKEQEARRRGRREGGNPEPSEPDQEDFFEAADGQDDIDPGDPDAQNEVADPASAGSDPQKNNSSQNLHVFDIFEEEFSPNTSSALPNQPTEPTNQVECTENDPKTVLQSCRPVGSIGQAQVQDASQIEKAARTHAKNAYVRVELSKSAAPATWRKKLEQKRFESCALCA
jgi:hypothetical protein